MHTLIDWQKSVIPLLDKMYITENLVYNKHTGTLIGFTDLGEVNEHSDSNATSTTSAMLTSHMPINDDLHGVKP